MDRTISRDSWPDEAQMPAGAGLPDQPLQLWEADGWSHASLVIATRRCDGGAPAEAVHAPAAKYPPV